MDAIARELVMILEATSRMPGTGMTWQALRTKFGWDRRFFEQGLAYAEHQGWLQGRDGPIEPGSFILLTEAGYRAVLEEQ